MCQGKTGGDAALALFSRQTLLVGDSLPATQRNAEGEINARLSRRRDGFLFRYPSRVCGTTSRARGGWARFVTRDLTDRPDRPGWIRRVCGTTSRARGGWARFVARDPTTGPHRPG